MDMWTIQQCVEKQRCARKCDIIKDSASNRPPTTQDFKGSCRRLSRGAQPSAIQATRPALQEVINCSCKLAPGQISTVTRWFAQCMIRAGLSDNSHRMMRAKTGMIRALMVMIRASETFCNVFVEVFVNYTIMLSNCLYFLWYFL